VVAFTDGSVWQVAVKRTTGLVAYLAPLVERNVYLVLIRAGIKGRTWVRTQLILGDITRRPRQQIYADFSALLAQDPPVVRNYRTTLNSDRGDPIEWIAYERTLT
jgi:hypothetical protein